MDTPAPTADMLSDQKRRLNHILDSWKASLKLSTNRLKPDITTKLAYKLGHKYTNANLKLAHLKGQDRAQAVLMQEACEANGFRFLLANVERSVFGECDGDEDDYYGWGSSKIDDDFHDINEIYDDNIKLTLVVRADGTAVAEELDFRTSDIVQPNVFDGEPDDEEYSGPTGNEGVTTTHFYRDTCMLAIPEHYYIDFVFPAMRRRVGGIPGWIDDLLSEYRTTENATNKSNLDRLCCCVLSDINDHGFGDTIPCSNGNGPRMSGDLAVVIKAAVYLNDPKLLEKTAACRRALPADAFESVGRLIQSTTIFSLHAEVCLPFGLLKLGS